MLIYIVLLRILLKMIRFIRIKIYNNSFKKLLRRKCSKVNFIAIKICSANDSFFVVELIPLREGGGEMNLGHAHKTRFWSPNFNEHLRHFYRGVPPGIRARLRSYYLVNNLNIPRHTNLSPSRTSLLLTTCAFRVMGISYWSNFCMISLFLANL